MKSYSKYEKIDTQKRGVDMEINKNFLNYVKQHDKEITEYFKKNEDKFTNILSSINSIFSSTLSVIGSYPKFYTVINQKGNILWNYGYGSNWGSANKFFISLPQIKKDIKQVYEKDGELKARMIDTIALVIQHFVNLYANPVCVRVEFRGDAWEEMNDYYAIAVRYKNYIDYLSSKIDNRYENNSTGIRIVQTLLGFEDVYLYYTNKKRLKYIYVLVENIAENDSEDEDYDFEGQIVDVSDKEIKNYTKLEVGDYYGECVGYSYFHIYDDPLDI